MTRAEELADFCRWFNSRRPKAFKSLYILDMIELERRMQADKDIKVKTMYVPAWDRKIILAAWIGGELVYDRRADE